VTGGGSLRCVLFTHPTTNTATTSAMHSAYTPCQLLLLVLVAVFLVSVHPQPARGQSPDTVEDFVFEELDNTYVPNSTILIVGQGRSGLP
jgi:hypothetical protein